MKKIITILFVFVLSKTLFSTNYYISTSGSDLSTGLIGFPKKTLQSVISTYTLVSGDIIYVAAGTYTTESNITIGATDVNFSIIGASASTTIFSFDQTNRFLTLNSTNDNISFSKITIKNYKKSSDGGAILMNSGSDNCTFTSVIFDNCDANTAKGGALYLDGNVVTFSKCIFKNCDASSYGGAIAAYNSTCNLNISKCTFFSNTGTYGSALEIEGTSSSLTITNSLFYKNTCSSNGTIGWDKGTSAVITNCTITYNSGPNSGIVQWDLLSNNPVSNIKNTISYNNTGSSNSDFYENGGTINLYNCLSTSNNTSTSLVSIHGTISSCIIGSPSFTNNVIDDYTLLVSSNCINAGLNVASGGMSDDLNSFTRINLPDVGAFEYSTVLPVELISFKGKSFDGYNELYWITASENNNDYFILQKSNDGINFYEIFRINGAVDSKIEINYNFTDYNIETKVNYYILKQVDYNGFEKSTDIISLENKFNNLFIVKKTNLIGQEIDDYYSGLVLFIYNDGTIIKKYITSNK